jgi:serine/threonine-protein kinase RsbW
MIARDSPAELRFRGSDALDAALKRTFSTLDTLRLPPAHRDRLAIIVEELLANLFEHGRITPDSAIVLRVTCFEDHVQLVLEDGGIAFDPTSGRTDAPIPERGGGAGLALVRAWAEQLSYSAGPTVNRLELRYSLTPSGD